MQHLRTPHSKAVWEKNFIVVLHTLRPLCPGENGQGDLDCSNLQQHLRAAQNTSKQ